MTKQIPLSADDYINVFGPTRDRPVNTRSLHAKHLTRRFSEQCDNRCATLTKHPSDHAPVNGDPQGYGSASRSTKRSDPYWVHALYQSVHKATPLQTGISILAVPVGTVIHQATFRVGWMCSWPLPQAPDTVCGIHSAVELTGSSLALGNITTGLLPRFTRS